MYVKYIKRAVDLITALLITVLISPLLLLITVAVAADSKGSPFFLQERIGKNGKVFKIIKFRTMIVGAEKIGDGIRVSSTDSRITRVGAFLRKTSLDELPQLFNVIAGQMSFVGPRPPVTYHPYNGYDGYPDWAKPRFSVSPGITGYAQVAVRNLVPWDERMRYDIEYVNFVSFSKDISILFGTAAKLLRRDSVYAEIPKTEYAEISETENTAYDTVKEETDAKA